MKCIDEENIDYVKDWKLKNDDNGVDGVVEKRAKLDESSNPAPPRLVIDCVLDNCYVLQPPNRNIFHGAKVTKRLPGDASDSSSSDGSASDSSDDDDGPGSLPELNETPCEVDEVKRCKSA